MKILFIVPYPELKDTVEKVVENTELPPYVEIIIDVHAVENIEQLNPAGYDAIITRGYTSKYIRKRYPGLIDTDLDITSYDIIRSFRKIATLYRPGRVAYCGGYKYMEACQDFSEFLGCPLGIYYAAESEDIKGAVLQAAADGCDLILGGFSVVSCAKELGMTSVLIETGEARSCLLGGKLMTGVSTLPDLPKDATDRNRTSPFAFTGNKFEFRMVGSADSIASPNTVLNAIVAEAFCEAADVLEKADDFEMAVHDLIKQYMTEHHRIIFNGNGYSDEWVQEAERRGLPNIRSMVESASALTTDKAVKLFEKFHIFTKAELESREEVQYETYAKSINIEALTMIDMASRQIIPAVVEYTQKLAKTVLDVKAAGVEPSVQTELLAQVNEKLTEMKGALANLQKIETEASAMEDIKAQAFFYKDAVMPAMAALRKPADELEMLVDKEDWPFPTYGDLMFEV